MKVLNFKLQLVGEKAVVDKQNQITDAINESTRALAKFAKSSEAFDIAMERANGLYLELGKVNERMANLGANIAMGQFESPQGLAEAGREYDTLVAKTKELEKAHEDALKEVARLAKEVQKLSKTKPPKKSPLGPLEEEAEGAATELRRLNKAIKEGAGRGDAEYAKIVTRVAQLKAEQKAVTDEVRRQQRAFEESAFAAGSYRQLNAELGRLRAQYRDMSEEARESTGGKELLATITKQNQKLKDLDKDMGIYVRNVGNYKSAISGVVKAVRGLAGITVFGTGAKEIVEANARISDSIADVRKTTQLGAKDLAGYDDAVVQLSDNLKGLDTRTSFAELLDISRIGGQLGIGQELIEQFKTLRDLGKETEAALVLDQAREELFGFTEAIDKTVVALGDELGGGVEGISQDLGKLNQVLGVADEKGTAGGILAIGSAINSLGASGTTNGRFIVDFAKRVGSIAPQANISAAQVLGLGATLDELGQSPEVAATSIQKLLIAIGQDVPKFAEIAGVSVKEFSETLKVDGNEALLQVLEGAGATGGGLEELGKILEDFGISGARTSQVLGVLTSNTDLLRKRQALASEEFEKATSIQEEFNIKNQTLGAEIDKLKKAFIGLVVDTGLQDFLARTVRNITSLITQLGMLPKFIKENQELFVALTIALIAFNAQAIKGAASSIKMAFSLKVLSKEGKIATTAMRVFNTVVKANPIGFVIGLIAALVGALIYLYQNFDTVRERVDNAWEALQAFVKGAGPFGVAIDAFIVKPIKAVIFVVKNLTNIWGGVQEAFKQGGRNLKNSFAGAANEARIAGLVIKKAFTFDGDAVRALDAEIDGLRKKNEKLRSETQTLGKAFARGFKEAQEETERQARQAAVDRLAKEEAEAKVKAEQAAREKEKARAAAAEEERKKQERKNIEEEKRRAKEAQARAVKAEQDRQKAVANIRSLQTGLIESDTEREVAGADTQARTNLAGLVGDPEQIVEQSKLVQQTLAKQVDEIYQKQATVLATKAKEELGKLGKEGGGLLPDPQAIQVQADAVTATLNEATGRLFDNQRKALEVNAQAQVKALVGDPETVAQQTQVIQEELQRSLEQVETRRQEFQTVATVKEQERQLVVRQLQVQSLEETYQQEKVVREQQLVERLDKILEEAEQEVITREEAQRRINEAKKEAADLEKEKELEAAEERRDTVEATAKESLALAADIAQKEIAIAEAKNKQLLENEKKTQKARNAILQGQLGLLDDFVGGVKDLLGQDEKNRKEHAGLIKTLTLGEIAINLIREISSINAANSIYPDPAGAIIKAIAVGKAVLQAAISVAKVNAAKFEGGNELPVRGPLAKAATKQRARARTAAAASAQPGPDTPVLSGLTVTPGGKIQVGPAPTPPPPTGAGVEDALAGPQVHAGLKGYAPPGHLFAVGQGYVPYEGEVVGPSHKAGGVKVVNEYGDLMEFEGGEFILRNGRRAYIINKRNTAIFKPQLRQLTKGSGVESPARHAAASAINAHKGNGVAFAGGGIIKIFQGGGEVGVPGASTGEVPALATTLVQPPRGIDGGTGAEAQQTEFLERVSEQNDLIAQQLEATQANVVALEEKVLNMEVILDPKEIVKRGLDAIDDEDNVAGL